MCLRLWFVFASVLGLCFVGDPVGAQGPTSSSCLVVGKVVDKNGHPVAGARVLLAGADGTPLLTPSEVATGDDGVFTLEAGFLYGVPDDGVRALLVQDRKLPRSLELVNFDRSDTNLVEAASAKRRVLLKADGRIDVGSVTLVHRRVRVPIQIVDRAGKPLLTTRAAWEDVAVRVARPRTGRYEITSMAQAGSGAIAIRESTLDVSLPEGEWDLQVSLSGSYDPWIVPEGGAVSVRSDQSVIVHLREDGVHGASGLPSHPRVSEPRRAHSRDVRFPEGLTVRFPSTPELTTGEQDVHGIVCDFEQYYGQWDDSVSLHAKCFRLHTTDSLEARKVLDWFTADLARGATIRDQSSVLCSAGRWICQDSVFLLDVPVGLPLRLRVRTFVSGNVVVRLLAYRGIPSDETDSEGSGWSLASDFFDSVAVKE